jgi:ABC-type transport system involved in cytochrome c biogenesis permease subunit
MISGGIWGYYAWGTYWLWTPKELWTSVLWLFYALLLHVRLKGPRWDAVFAWFGIAGAFVMLFTYLISSNLPLMVRQAHHERKINESLRFKRFSGGQSR